MDDREITGINLAFLNRHGPTNVIAFPMREGAYGDLTPNLLGDVVICVDTAFRESRLAGRTLEERVTELLVHGVLHLCGYDHENGGRPARRMADKSRRLVKKIEESWKLEAGSSKPKQGKASPATSELAQEPIDTLVKRKPAPSFYSGFQLRAFSFKLRD